ncbi:flagellar rod assembly protein FlgJ [Bradyrhizobium elkanii]|uniref:Flagellar rod assembly protein FlgJ n=2 Tax=Bradyrhizobium TaxID=374 RepID=A0A4U6RXB5_BRAEL|nr:flagellar rod assembly protein FlgJ [Bradyrhizobium sp. BR2003]TKV79350.1 flagellar rod assembly protein FlgJ [Bradyrhizobium elkanii]
MASLINSTTGSMPNKALMPTFNGRPDPVLQDALKKVTPQQAAKAKATATDFESMFLNSMFSQMTTGLKGDGPYGDTVGTGAWRSMLTDEYSKNFAKAGGVGISNEVFRSLILQQANKS